MAVYLDTSAAMKLAVAEAESEALRTFLALATDGFVSSALLAVELRRAALRSRDPASALAAVANVIPAIRLVRMDDDILGQAGILLPPSVRSLDAIHLATALSLGPAVETMICYDTRLAEAATAAGMNVQAPADR
jgi:uncharacterized protein